MNTYNVNTILQIIRIITGKCGIKYNRYIGIHYQKLEKHKKKISCYIGSIDKLWK